MRDLSEQYRWKMRWNCPKKWNVLLGHFVPIQNMEIQNVFVKVHIYECLNNLKKNVYFMFINIINLIANIFAK